MKTTLSPLRYPGGKTKLFNHVNQVIKTNHLTRYTYVEPFAGGAGLALKLLEQRSVKNIVINDYDRSIHALWYAILNHTEALIKKIVNTDITMDEWYVQRNIQDNKENEDLLELGYSTLFLNRTNRSGIIKAGVLGGKEQSGDYKMDCRFNKLSLIKKIIIISEMKSRILLLNEDAEDLIERLQSEGNNYFVYLDPPYYQKGKKLYLNFYNRENHQSLAKTLNQSTMKYIVSYDDCSEIRNIYKGYKYRTYSLHHSVSNNGQGKEIVFFSKNVRIPRNFSSIKFN